MFLRACAVVRRRKDCNIWISLYFLKVGPSYFVISCEKEPFFFVTFSDYRCVLHIVLLAFCRITENDSEIAYFKVRGKHRNG